MFCTEKRNVTCFGMKEKQRGLYKIYYLNDVNIKNIYYCIELVKKLFFIMSLECAPFSCDKITQLRYTYIEHVTRPVT